MEHLIGPHLVPLIEETRAFYADRVPGRGPSGYDELMAMRAALSEPFPSDPPPSVETVSAGGREVRVRIHRPRIQQATGIVLELHGGGFYLGSAIGSDARNRQLADEVDAVVVSVDYRLAPEHPWPSAPEDCETAALWALEHGAERFGTARVAVTGFSAGSTLAMTTLLRLRDRGHTVDGAVLQFGTYDLSGRTPAGRLIADEYFLDAYAGLASDRTDPDVSPIYAELDGLPPVLMVVGEDDVLLDDNVTMADRLAGAGGDVDLRVYPASPHGFTGHPTPMARAAWDDMIAWLRSRFAS